jgi:hypothetical protein
LKNEYLYNMSSFIDPIKELPGPPSLSGNGLKFKSPTVDSPNVNLPSSIPKNLNPSSALKKSKILSIKDKSSGLQDKVGGLTGGLQDKAGGLTGGLQDKAGGLTGGLQDKAGGLQDRLNDIKSDVPNPKVNVPIGERIRIIKIK